MEALLLILLDAIVAPLLAVASSIALVVGTALTTAAAFLVDLAARWFRRQPRPADASGSRDDWQLPAESPAAPRQSGWAFRIAQNWRRRLLTAGAACVALLLAALVVVDQWFLEDVARHLLRRQQERSGIAIAATSITGSLFTGRFHAAGVTVQRLDRTGARIDLRIDRVDAGLRIWRVFGEPLVIDSLALERVRGSFDRGARDDAASRQLPAAPAAQARRAFEVSKLDIQDLDVIYTDPSRGRSLVIPVAIRSLTTEPLRSRLAVFDLLFRTDAEGSLAGTPVSLATIGEAGGRDTQWRANGLPVAILAGLIGGPFEFLTAGTANVQVVDHWRRDAGAVAIDMDWSLVLEEVRAEVPPDTSPLLAKLAAPAVAFLNAHSESVPLSFRVTIDERRFEGAASAAAAGLWQAVAESAAASLAKKLGLDVQTVEAVGRRALDATKSLLDKARRKG